MHASFFRPRLLFALLIVANVAACNFPATGPITTPDPGTTQVYQTISARLTQAVTQKPAASPSPEATSDPAASPSLPASPLPPETDPPQPTATQVCDLAAAGNPIDLSIPDDTLILPGQAFTKRWALENAGACTWTKDYRVTFLYGEQMGAPDSVALGNQVGPGQIAEITIDMIAPATPGTYRSNWKLRSDSNNLFGIGPNGTSPFWVQIIVVQPDTATPGPPTATSTMTPTTTATPAPQAAGPVTLLPGSRLDLDQARANPESGEDLIYESNADGNHLLVPQGNALISLYGTSQPTLTDCLASNLGSEPIQVENLGTTYLCYRTNQGLPGRALVTNFRIDDFSVTLDLLTWIAP
jgi:hypothetical protein